MWSVMVDVCAVISLVAIVMELRALRRGAQDRERAAEARHRAWLGHVEALGHALGFVFHRPQTDGEPWSA